MKLVKKLLTLIDYVAMTIGLLGICTIIATAICIAIWRVVAEFGKAFGLMWANHSDRAIIIIFLLSLGWCAARWKNLNSKE